MIPLRFKKKSKFGNTKVVYNGMTFDSKLEKERFVFLSILCNSGEISNLRRQVRIELIPAVKKRYIKHLKTKDKEVEVTVQRPIVYTADFVYNLPDGSEIWEDTKSKITMEEPAFNLRRKMLLALKNIHLHIVLKPREAPYPDNDKEITDETPG